MKRQLKLELIRFCCLSSAALQIILEFGPRLHLVVLTNTSALATLFAAELYDFRFGLTYFCCCTELNELGSFFYFFKKKVFVHKVFVIFAVVINMSRLNPSKEFVNSPPPPIE